MLGAQGICATGFKRAQGNAHCAKFESHTNRVTFETNTIRMTSSVQAHIHTNVLKYFWEGDLLCQNKNDDMSKTKNVSDIKQ